MKEKKFWQKLKKNHFLLMVLCCAIPVVLVIGFALFKSSESWAWLFILLCPLMHIFMMKGHKHNENHEKDDHDS